MNPELKALLDKYAAAGASDDELRHVADTWKAKNAPTGIHAEYQADPAAFAQRQQAKSAADTGENDPTPSGFQAGRASIRSGLETLGSSIPFVGPLVNRAFGGIRHLTEGIPYDEALRRENEDIKLYQSENPRASLGLAAGGASLIPFGKLTRAGSTVLGGGTAAAQRFGQTANPDESLADRLKGTAEAGGVGASLGFVAPSIMSSPTLRTLAGAGAGAFLAPEDHRLEGAVVGGGLAANPSGVSALIANASDRAFPGLASAFRNVSNATGTRGLVNREVEGINRLAKPLGTLAGAQAPGGAQAVAQAQQFEAQSKVLYDAAKNSPQVLTDPKTVALLSDPDLAKGFGVVDQIRSESGRGLPQRVVGQQTVTSSLLQPNGQPFTYTQPVTGSVPDPEALHLLKRIIRDRVDRGFNSESPIPIEEALKLQPKVQALAEHLHDVSPEYKAADNFFQLGATAQETNALGYGAAKPGMQNPSAGALGTKDVAGVRQFVASQGHADPQQDAALKAVSAAQAQAGARNQLAQQVAARGLAGGRAGVLNAPGLAISGPAAEQRALALGADAPAFENVLTKVGSEAAADAPTANRMANALVSRATHGMVHLPTVNPADKAIQSKLGQSMLSNVIRDPQQYQQALTSYLQGRSQLEELGKILGVTVAQRATR